MRSRGSGSVVLGIAVTVLPLAGMAGAFLLFRQQHQAMLHPEPTPLHRQRMQADLELLEVRGLKVKSVRYVDTDMPGMCAEVEVAGQKNPADGLRRIRSVRSAEGEVHSPLQFSHDRHGYVFFERAGRLDTCVAGHGYVERLRFEYLVADSAGTGQAK